MVTKILFFFLLIISVGSLLALIIEKIILGTNMFIDVSTSILITSITILSILTGFSVGKLVLLINLLIIIITGLFIVRKKITQCFACFIFIINLVLAYIQWF